jgi:hypothetical protein
MSVCFRGLRAWRHGAFQAGNAPYARSALLFCMLAMSCNEMPSNTNSAGSFRSTQELRAVLFNPNSENELLAEAIFDAFCSQNECHARKEYLIAFPEAGVRTEFQFRYRQGIDPRRYQSDFFSCSLFATTLYCGDGEKAILEK